MGWKVYLMDTGFVSTLGSDAKFRRSLAAYRDIDPLPLPSGAA